MIPRIVTDRILVNGVIGLDAARFLQKQGVTHLLSLVGAYPDGKAIRELGLTTAEYRIGDQATLNPNTVVKVLNDMDTFLAEDNSKIYVHCVAGQVRSPTIVWLYLLHSGHSAEDATKKLENCGLRPSQHLLHGFDVEKIKRHD